MLFIDNVALVLYIVACIYYPPQQEAQIRMVGRQRAAVICWCQTAAMHPDAGKGSTFATHRLLAMSFIMFLTALAFGAIRA